MATRRESVSCSSAPLSLFLFFFLLFVGGTIGQSAQPVTAPSQFYSLDLRNANARCYGNVSVANTITNDFTLEAWVFMTARANESTVIPIAGNLYGTSFGYSLQLINNSATFVVVTKGNGVGRAAETMRAKSPSAIPLNQWTHLFGVYAGSSSVTLYVNMVQVGFVTQPNAASVSYPTYALPFYVGYQESDLSDSYFSGGLIGAARLWSTSAITQSSAVAFSKQFFSLSSHPNHNQLVGQWRFGSTSNLISERAAGFSAGSSCNSTPSCSLFGCDTTGSVCGTNNLCLLYSCFGRMANDSLACSGAGLCVDTNQCQCNAGFFGSQCQLLTNATSTPVYNGTYSLALQLDGSTCYANMSNAVVRATIGAELTVEAWVRLSSSITEDRGRLRYMGVVGDMSNFDNGFHLMINGSQPMFAVRTAYSSTPLIAHSSSSLALGTWYHLAGTFKQNSAHLYINGQLTATSAVLPVTSTRMSDEPARTLSVGVYQTDLQDFYFNGTIDEVRIWSAALPQQTILRWMNSSAMTSHPNYAALQAHYTFNGNGTVVTDSSTQANNGRLFGTCSLQPNCQVWGCADSGSTCDPFTGSCFKGAADTAALSLDGASCYVNVTTSSVFGNSVTVEAWINPAEAVEQSRTFRGIAGTAYDTSSGFMIEVVNGTQPSFVVTIREPSGAVSLVRLVSSVRLVAGRWTHVAGAFDPSGPVVLYVDGAAVANVSVPAGSSILSNFGDALVIGVHQTNLVDYYFKGMIDEVRVWRASLSGQTIAAWFRKQATPLHPNYNSLTAYYVFAASPLPVIADSGPLGSNTGVSRGNCSIVPNCQLWGCIAPGTQCVPSTGQCVTQCYDIASTNSSVCSGRGTCVGFNNCNCGTGWGGFACQFPICGGLTSDMAAVCSGVGRCTAPSTCACQAGNYTGSVCQFPMCYDIGANNASVCSGQGTCTAVNKCNCSLGYTGNQCQYAICFDISAENTSVVCSGRGQCIRPNECSCLANQYGGQRCQFPLCNGILSTQSNVCNSRGNCSRPNNCDCVAGYSGADCQHSICFGIPGNNTASVCSGVGNCTSPNNCTCSAGYTGSQCQIRYSSVRSRAFISHCAVCAEACNPITRLCVPAWATAPQPSHAPARRISTR